MEKKSGGVGVRTPQMIEASKKTRFGAAKSNVTRQEKENPTVPWAIRNGYRRLMGMEIDLESIDLDNPKALIPYLKRLHPDRKYTMAQVSAAAVALKAMKGELESIKEITTANEGAIAQPAVQPQIIALTRLQDMTLEELQQSIHKKIT